MTQNTARHHIYLLQCWQEISDGDMVTWRFRLDGMSPEERFGFGSLDDLTRFLRRRLETHHREPKDEIGNWTERRGGVA